MPEQEDTGPKVNLMVRGYVRASIVPSLRELLKDEQVTISEQPGIRLSATQEKVLRLLAATEGWVTSVKLEELTGIAGNTLRPALGRLQEYGLASRVIADKRDLAGPAKWEATAEGRGWVGEHPAD